MDTRIKFTYHISSLITSATSSADGSPLSQNHEKKVRFSRGLFLPDRAAAAAARCAALAAKSKPSFQRIGVLCEAGSPDVPKWNSLKGKYLFVFGLIVYLFRIWYENIIIECVIYHPGKRIWSTYLLLVHHYQNMDCHQNTIWYGIRIWYPHILLLLACWDIADNLPPPPR